MNKTDLSSYNNEWFKKEISASRLKQSLWYFANIIFIKNTWNPLNGLKCRMLKLFGAKLGKSVMIKPGVNIKYPWKLAVGDYTWIGENVWIDNLAPVHIGSNVCISQGAMLLTGNHNYAKTTFDLSVQPVTLEDGAWIGAQTVVCPGVTVRSHAVLTVGSVATRDLEPYGVYSGNPALRKKDRTIL